MKHIVLIIFCLFLSWALFAQPTHGPQVQVNDEIHKIYDNGDTTKKMRFEVSNVSSGNIRTIIMADSDVNLADIILAETDPCLSAINTEALFEAWLSDVSDIFTNNDGALDDDDLSNNSIHDLSDVGAADYTSRNVLIADGDSWESRALVEADISDLGSYLTDAPSDGTTYGRKDGVWSAVSEGTDDQTIDIFTISGNDIQLSLEDDGEATKTVDVSTTTAVTANSAKVTESTTVNDTNTIDLTLSTYDITADLRYQNTATVNLSEDGSGLKADLVEVYLTAESDPCFVASDANNLTYGTEDQIPVTNTAGDGFDYSANLIFDGTTLTTNGIVPKDDNQYNLGSNTKRWAALYVYDNIFLNRDLDLTGGSDSQIDFKDGATLRATLTIDGSNNLITTSESGTVSFGDDNLTTTGTITGNSLMDGTATLTGGSLTDVNNLGIGTATFGTSAQYVLGIAAGTTPTSSPANMVQLYAEKQEEDIGTDLENHWLMNDTSGTTLKDNMGNDNGTLQGGNTFDNLTVAGKINEAIDFDGTDDYVTTAANIYSNADAADGFTVCLWAKTTTASKGIMFSSEGVINIGINYAGQANKADFYAWDSGSNRAFSTSSINDGQWHHLAMSYNGINTSTLYVDGEAENTLDHADLRFEDFSRATAIGAWHDGQLKFDGIIDDVRVYLRSLDGGEIAAIYNDGDGTESESTTFEAGYTELKVRDEEGNVTTLSANVSNYPDDISASEQYPYVSKKQFVYEPDAIRVYIAENKMAELVQQLAWDANLLPKDKYIIKYVDLPKRLIENRQVQKLMEKSVEVPKSEAVIQVDITEPKIIGYRLVPDVNSVDGNVVQVKQPIYESIPTGEKKWQLKSGYRLTDDGKFYRNLSKQEAEDALNPIVIEPIDPNFGEYPESTIRIR